MDAKSIVNENFKGLDKLINSEDLTHFYKSLIETCLDEYANKKAVEFYDWAEDHRWEYDYREGRTLPTQELYQLFEDATNRSNCECKGSCSLNNGKPCRHCGKAVKV